MIKLIDSLINALSLHISNRNDIIQYLDAYESMRETLFTFQSQNINDFEPLRRHRYLIRLPEQFEIPTWQVQNIYLPTLSYNWLRIKKWSPLIIDIMNIIGRNNASNFIQQHERMKDYEINIQGLDPTGMVVHEIIVKIKRIIMVDLGSYASGNDNIQISRIVFKVKDLIINY